MTGIADSGSTLFGPVELNVISLPGSAPSPELLAAVVQQVRSGVVRVLDFVVVTKAEGGEVVIEEIDLDESGVTDLNVEIVVPGLTSNDDLELLAADLAPGTSAAVVAFELVWARDLAAQVAADGCTVLASERIPAPVVNALVEMEAES
ncbi:DUF6325 family protein [Gordonia neofelifaecis]|uniref:DUF1269 domain-containing protein n=1 Tax=Gordonia neofelifaecis NRRL B-59395 TaxID=644548 RepID=F1YNN4_9ACTN|nr:DUF6325 family protein [Gordonia neofelifaecis]EGD53644.1 hypothetical protein SCNU_17667 [Gordonia neofelifaecis NRRL B-59395]